MSLGFAILLASILIIWFAVMIFFLFKKDFFFDLLRKVKAWDRDEYDPDENK